MVSVFGEVTTAWTATTLVACTGDAPSENAARRKRRGTGEVSMVVVEGGDSGGKESGRWIYELKAL